MLTRGVEQRLGDIVMAEQDPSAKLFIPALARAMAAVEAGKFTVLDVRAQPR